MEKRIPVAIVGLYCQNFGAGSAAHGIRVKTLLTNLEPFGYLGGAHGSV